ncbi:MAG: PD-(D/E)XK nuclease family protein, partial [Oscillospiraceae bacterium]|nr:PD-(D/E)XK nuclease family protein [Oscillospiraceae bacterium]
TGLIWLTPEPFSHECERMLAERGGPAVCLSAEVLTFRRLTDRVFAEESHTPVLDEGGRLLAMRLAADMAESGLELWRGAARRADFLRRLLSTLDQCKSYGVTPETLLEAADAAEGHAARKLTELSLIFAAYNGLVSGDRSPLDPRDRLERLCDRLEDGAYLSGKRLYVDGYVTFTPLEHRVLDICVRRAAAVTLALTGTPGDPFFRVPAQTARRIRRGLTDKEAREVVIAGAYRAGNETLQAWEALLTEPPSPGRPPAENGAPPPNGTPAPAAPAQEPPLQTAFCASPGAELQFAAEAIARWTAQGLRYRDIAVILPAAGPYEALAEAALDKHGIPVFTDRLDDVRTKPLARLLRAARDVWEHGWRGSDVAELLRTGLTRVPAEAADELETYTRLWDIAGRRWTDAAPWTQPPGGYGTPPESADAEAAALRRIHRARVLLAAPLRELAGGRTAEDWARRTARFLESCRVPRALKRRAAQLDALGERKLSEESRQLWDILVRALEQCAAVLGDRPMARAEFFDLLLLTLSAYSVGSIPASLDRVTVGTAGRLRRLRVRAAILPGCRAALMPRFDAPDSLLAAEEIAALEGAGAELPPGDEDRLSRAMFDLYMAAALPSERLLLTACPEENGRQAPAALLEAARALPGVPSLEPELPAPPEVEWPHLRAPLDEEAVRSLYGRELYLSASRLKLFSECRQAFFLRYGLRARPRPAQSYTALDRGSFVHEILERVGRHFAGRDARDIPGAELRAAALDYARSYAETCLRSFVGQTRRFERSFAALTAAALEAVDDVFGELRRSRFRPAAYELAFGGPPREGAPSLPAVSAGRVGRFSIQSGGKGDRVDVWRAPGGKLSVRAAGYKTGAAGGG